MPLYTGEFLCVDCNRTFDLTKDVEVECPWCGSLEALPTVEPEETE